MENFNDLKMTIQAAAKKDFGFLENPEVSLLELSENMTCLVVDGGRKYILQVNRLGYRTEAELEGEFTWLQELNEEPGLKTAKVYTGSNGKVRQTFVSPGGTKYNYSLQEFLEGRKLRDLDENRIAEQMSLVGETAAKLHLQSLRREEKGEPIAALRWDIDEIVSPTARWGYFRDYPGLKFHKGMLLGMIELTVRDRLEEYGREPDRYGLIHADIHANNILINDGELAVIDFDDCGYGWFLYDLGSAVSKFSYGLGEMAASLIEGYEKHRPLSEEDKAIIPTMIMMRRLARIGWLASHRENGVLDKEGNVYLDRTCEMAKGYMENNTLE